MFLNKKIVRPGVIGLGGAQPDGNTPPTGRQARTAEACVTQTHGKYYEPASRGSVYAACDQGVGVAVQVTLTTTATLTLHNPVNSGKRISILKVMLTYFSGTLGAGSFYHGFLGVGKTLPVIGSGVSLTANCTDVGVPLGVTAVGVAFATATVTAGTPLYPFIGTGPVLASSVVVYPPLIEDIDGLIVLEPGAQYQLLGVFGGTGTSPKVSPGIIWEEIAII